MATNSFYRTPHLTTISFALGVLLFFLPFMEIKCNETTLVQMSGLNMVTGAEPKVGSDFEQMSKGFDTKNEGTKTATKSDKKGKVYIMAIVALGLGVIGVAISFMNKDGYSPIKMIAGAVGAVALIILMFQVKGDANEQMTADKKGSDQMAGMMKLSVDFTFWFYLCVISYLASAFFSYKQKDLVSEGYTPPANAPQINIQNPGDQSDFPAATSGEKDLG
jgi:hypothetical protein